MRWHSRPNFFAVTVSIGLLACACSDGETNDSGVAGMDATDTRDATEPDADAGGGDARDSGRRDADAPDLGAPDLGSCGCSYGFQQQCAEDETCGLGFSGEPMCSRADPFNACTRTVTTTATEGAACTAQCVSALHGSPCGDVAPSSVEDALDVWWLAVGYAFLSAPSPGLNPMRASDISVAIARTMHFPECGEFIKQTVLAAASLCLDGAVVAPPAGAFDALLEWKFQHIDPNDECRIAAINNCAGALVYGPSMGENSAALVDTTTTSCAVLPYAAPCQGADAQACLRSRIATMIRALNTPLGD